jgi:hypothetical protein
LVSKAGRKLFQKEEKKPTMTDSQDHHSKRFATSKIAGVATGGALVLCCVFLCACFQKKRKATSHTVLSKDPNISEYK